MLGKFTQLTCKPAFQHKQLIICEGSDAPSCPYFAPWAWLPNSALLYWSKSSIFWRSRKEPSPDHSQGVSGTVSPAGWSDQPLRVKGIAECRSAVWKSIFRVQVTYDWKDTLLKSSRTSSRKQQENILHHSLVFPGVCVRLESCLRTAGTIRNSKRE